MLSRDEIQRIARLARLSLAADEIDRLARELSAILEWAEQLRGLDGEELPEAAGAAMAPVEPSRADDPRSGLPRDVALGSASAADPEEGTFLVPPVLDSETAA